VLDAATNLTPDGPTPKAYSSPSVYYNVRSI
jgi:hypothetical protein